MTLDRQWEKFRGGPEAATRHTARVTINTKGMIYMNKNAYAALGHPKAVSLYFNREEDAIAVEPAFERSMESFPVVKRLNGWAVHGGGFCRNFGITIPKTQRFIRPDLTSESHMILSLRETVTVGGYKKGLNRKVEN